MPRGVLFRTCSTPAAIHGADPGRPSDPPLAPTPSCCPCCSPFLALVCSTTRLSYLQQYMEQIQADPHVCAINGSQPPAPKRQRTSAPPAPAATAAAARPAVQQKPKPKPPSRLSEPGYAAPLPPAPPPAPVVTYGLPNRMAPHDGETPVAALVRVLHGDQQPHPLQRRVPALCISGHPTT